MAITCRKHAKCYLTKNGKKCLTPNPWIVFLRTHKKEFKSVGEASKYYQKFFKVAVLKKLVGVSGTPKQKKEAYHKIICSFFYGYMAKSGKNTPGNTAKISRGVTKLLKENSIPDTLAAMKGAKASSTRAAGTKAKVSADVKSKAKAVAVVKDKVVSTKKIAAAASSKATTLTRSAAAAKTAATKAQSKATSQAKAASVAKTRAAGLKKSVAKVSTKAKDAEKALAMARKKKAALAKLQTSMATAGKTARVRRKRVFTPDER